MFILKQRIKRVLYSCVGISFPNQLPNIRKTLVFNFLAFGMDGVRKKPVIIYGNTKIYKVGRIVINCEMKKGLLRIGQLDYKSQGETRFLNDGTIEINGPVAIGGCAIVENYGTIIFKGYNLISDGTSLLIRSKLTVGEETRVGFHSFIMDSDDHYTIDVERKVVSCNKKEISLGAYNWIANRTIIKKGVITPDYLIVASANALLTKDYTDKIPPYSVIGGAPARLLKTGIRRIYNPDNERWLKKYFLENPSENSIAIPVETEQELEDYCKQTSSYFS